MAARKLAQEIDKCFKKVSEGMMEFDAIYEKLEQSTSQAQKEKLEDNLKREIKKLQRLRDQIKAWASSSDIKDKAPLMEQRRLIETRMEKFKATEKAMKTKTYSKEGLSAATALDPKEQAKNDKVDFLRSQVYELEQQIEKYEAELESIQSTSKKGKVTGAKAERLGAIGRIIERHKWHIGKMELIQRSLENGGVEPEQVTDLEETIQFYVSDGATDENILEDDTIYDDLNLDEEEDQFGMNQDNDRVSSHDGQSVHDDAAEESKPVAGVKARTGSEPSAAAGGRRPSAQLKSPLPSLAALHTPAAHAMSHTAAALEKGLKPSTVPVRPPGEGLKYASAAAAAADRGGVGIAPLPPPATAPSVPNKPPTAVSSTSPAIPAAQPAASVPVVAIHTAQPSKQETIAPPQPSVPGPSAPPSATARVEPASKPATTRTTSGKAPPVAATPTATPSAEPVRSTTPAVGQPALNGTTNGVKSTTKKATPSAVAASAHPHAPPPQAVEEPAEEESIYHLPASLQDLVDAFEATQNEPPISLHSPTCQRQLAASRATAPELGDLEIPRRYHPDEYCNTPTTYPREVHHVFDNPNVYGRMDQDTLFYAFYYRQGSYQQYLASKALKEQSWRFHKQYQTWFQRHENPKNITEEFEQGTYRFFDYESTWMNRRKADFKFAYKFLEDEI